jgi:hypothetical protein
MGLSLKKCVDLMSFYSPLIAWFAFTTFTLNAVTSATLQWQVTLGLLAGVSLVYLVLKMNDPIG